MGAYDEKRRFFDESAPHWEHGAFDEEGERIARWILRRAGIAPGMTVLEPGCGAGRMTALLADAVGPHGRVIAVDISEKMIAAAHRNVNAANVEFRHGTTEDLGLAPDSVDLVLCFDVFPHFEDSGRALDSFHRWLAPEGKLVIAHYPGRRRVNAVHREAGRAVGADRLPDGREMRRLLNAHGFRLPEVIDRPDRYFLHSTPARQ